MSSLSSHWRSKLHAPKFEIYLVKAGLKEGLTPQEITKEYSLLLPRVCLIVQNIIDEADIFQGGNPRFLPKGRTQ